MPPLIERKALLEQAFVKLGCVYRHNLPLLREQTICTIPYPGKVLVSRVFTEVQPGIANFLSALLSAFSWHCRFSKALFIRKTSFHLLIYMTR